jgi:hypothetical protein
MFFLKKDLKVVEGNNLEGRFKVSTGNQNYRSLQFDLSYKLSTSKSFLKQHFVLEQ